MKQNERLRLAINLLSDILENWDEEEVVFYPETLQSFDELIASLRDVEFKQVE